MREEGCGAHLPRGCPAPSAPHSRSRPLCPALVPAPATCPATLSGKQMGPSHLDGPWVPSSGAGPDPRAHLEKCRGRAGHSCPLSGGQGFRRLRGDAPSQGHTGNSTPLDTSHMGLRAGSAARCASVRPLSHRHELSTGCQGLANRPSPHSQGACILGGGLATRK